MEALAHVLQRHAGTLEQHLAENGGFTRAQAADFVREGGEALLVSYRWQAGRLSRGPGDTDALARELLAGIHGRALAPRVGLSDARTWDGLRLLVPEVLRASLSEAPEGASGDLVRPTPGAPDRGHELEVGFGLRIEARPARPASPGEHPVFGRLLRSENREA